MFLEELTQTLIPSLERQLHGTPAWYRIAGYSIAGLFAIYRLYQTTMFSRAASVSGSLWYDGFPEYCRSHSPAGNVTDVYFSLGSKERRAKIREWCGAGQIRPNGCDDAWYLLYLLKGNFMKVVVAIDSFKGSLSSMRAGYAAREGGEPAAFSSASAEA